MGIELHLTYFKILLSVKINQVMLQILQQATSQPKPNTNRAKPKAVDSGRDLRFKWG